MKREIKTDIGIFGHDVEYPQRPTKPHLKHDATSEEAKEYAVLLESWEKEKVEYRKQRTAYREAENKMNEDFKKECFRSIGMSMDHPKAEKLWHMAWEESRSDGFNNVWYHFEELSELVDY